MVVAIIEPAVVCVAVLKNVNGRVVGPGLVECDNIVPHKCRGILILNAANKASVA